MLLLSSRPDELVSASLSVSSTIRADQEASVCSSLCVPQSRLYKVGDITHRLVGRPVCRRTARPKFLRAFPLFLLLRSDTLCHVTSTTSVADLSARKVNRRSDVLRFLGRCSGSRRRCDILRHRFLLLRQAKFGCSLRQNLVTDTERSGVNCCGFGFRLCGRLGGRGSWFCRCRCRSFRCCTGVEGDAEPLCAGFQGLLLGCKGGGLV